MPFLQSAAGLTWRLPLPRDETFGPKVALAQIVVPHVRLGFPRHEEVGESSRSLTIRERSLVLKRRQLGGREDGETGRMRVGQVSKTGDNGLMGIT